MEKRRPGMGLNLATSAKNYCQELLHFHCWRQETICKLLTELDSQVFSRELSGSFGSLYIICKHLVWAEKVWLGRVNHDEMATMREMDVLGMIEEWKSVTAKWTAELEKREEEGFQSPIEYFNSTGTRYENTLFEIVVHMIDHSTYHIGQMMNAVRGFGIDPVSTNYIHYLRATKS
ncbi:MAG: DinB family protein [Bacteroidota bacterium]